MIAVLIKDHGFSWEDFNNMTDEDLHDIVNAKAEKKRKRKSVNKETQLSSTMSLEDFVKNNGLL